mmetsp:Transcript_18012/g.30673  ORF Transcript_18012/g.30673 Transcript_18012/m.30673 type:complete len:124 (-) Transcript_18012:7-378(-)
MRKLMRVGASSPFNKSFVYVNSAKKQAQNNGRIFNMMQRQAMQRGENVRLSGLNLNLTLYLSLIAANLVTFASTLFLSSAFYWEGLREQLFGNEEAFNGSEEEAQMVGQHLEMIEAYARILRG